MGWSLGYDDNWKRDIGYGVPATCDHPGCGAAIDRGLSYVCGGEPYGGEHGCGLYFCESHLVMEVVGEWGEGDDHDCFYVCTRCSRFSSIRAPFEPTPDHPEWMRFKLSDYSWLEWRKANPNQVHQIQIALWGMDDD